MKKNIISHITVFAITMTLFIFPSPSHAADSGLLPDGDYVIANAGNPLYYLDIVGNEISPPNNTNVQLWKGDYIGDVVDETDVWTLKYSDGYYTISQKGTDMCLDLTDYNTNSGANIAVYERNGYDAQKWTITENGKNGYTVKAKCSGLALDVTDGILAYGTNIQQWTVDGTDAQAWVFIPYHPKRTLKDGDYIIVNKSTPSIYLDIPGTEYPAVANSNVAVNQVEDLDEIKTYDVWTIKYSNGYYTIRQKGTNMCLGLQTENTLKGTNVSVSTGNESITQKWAITGSSKDGYLIRSNCSGHALDIYIKVECGNNVQQWTCHMGNNQKWTLIPYYKYMSKATASLSGTSYTYTGKTKTPTVTVKYNGSKVKKGVGYKVTYSDNKKCGKAKVKITGIGRYKGTITKYFTIKPAKAVIEKTKVGTKKISILAKSQKTSGVSGYQYYCKRSDSSEMTILCCSSKNQGTFTGLKSGKKYIIKVRAYKTIDGKKVYGAWSKSKTLKVK